MLFFLFSKTQNLVPNYSFENYTRCPNGSCDGIILAFPWFSNLYCGNSRSGSSDYFNTCAPSSSGGVPLNGISYQNPRTGNAYACIIIGDMLNTNYREYIEVKTVKPFKRDVKYYLCMYLSLSNKAKFSINEVGFYLSSDSVVNPIGTTTYLLPYTPQVKNPSGNFLSDTLNWMPVSGIYIAKGGEQFITIGNFKDDAGTGRKPGYGNDEIYYYIDDVSVVELPEASDLTGGDKSICNGDSVLLGTAQKMNVSYSWQSAGEVSKPNDAQLWVKPTVTTTYTLTVSDTSVVCANSSSSSIRVSICPEEYKIFVPTGFSPNGDGSNDVLYVYGKNIESLELDIYNRWGERIADYRLQIADYDIKSGGFPTWNGMINSMNAQQGIYVWSAKVTFKDGKEEKFKGSVTLMR